jgi:hypothetical protein
VENKEKIQQYNTDHRDRINELQNKRYAAKKAALLSAVETEPESI